MSLTDQQMRELYELLELGSPEQRTDCWARLHFLDFHDKQQSYGVTGTDDVTEGDPREELIPVLGAIKDPVPFVHLDELE